MKFARKFFDAREIEGDARSLMNLHNNRAGRKVFKIQWINLKKNNNSIWTELHKFWRIIWNIENFQTLCNCTLLLTVQMSYCWNQFSKIQYVFINFHLIFLLLLRYSFFIFKHTPCVIRFYEISSIATKTKKERKKSKRKTWALGKKRIMKCWSASDNKSIQTMNWISKLYYEQKITAKTIKRDIFLLLMCCWCCCCSKFKPSMPCVWSLFVCGKYRHIITITQCTHPFIRSNWK